MDNYATMNAVHMLSQQMAFITTSPKGAEFIRLLRAAGTTPAQVQTWLTVNTDTHRAIFDNYYIVQAIIYDPIAAKLVYDSAKGAELAFSSACWIAEFVKQEFSVDNLINSSVGLRALWASEFALKLIYDSIPNSRVWERFMFYGTTIQARWAATGVGSSLPWWPTTGVANGTYLPYPGITGDTIVLKGTGLSISNTFSFNSRLRGGTELTNLAAGTQNSSIDTFAAHPMPSGTRTAGTSNGALFELTFIPIP